MGDFSVDDMPSFIISLADSDSDESFVSNDSENNLNVYCPPQKLRRLNDLYDDSSSENDETTEIIVIELVD